MNAERLLALYERVAEAPDAITRLRRFILDLAVRGKLVPQDPNDEPASELLKRIAKEKARLDRKERIKREPRSHDADAEPMQIPQGWALAPLADLVTVLNGRAYKQNELLSAGTPVLRVGNLFTSDKWYYSTLQLDEEKYCKKGDLIFAWSASFGPFIWDGERVIYHYHIWKIPLHSDADLSKLFLYNFLLQKTRQIKEAGHGISMIHMTKEKMEKIVVPLPPLAEQHRTRRRPPGPFGRHHSGRSASGPQTPDRKYKRNSPRNLVVPDQLSGLSPHRPTSPFPNHAAPQHRQNHFRSTR